MRHLPFLGSLCLRFPFSYSKYFSCQSLLSSPSRVSLCSRTDSALASRNLVIRFAFCTESRNTDLLCSGTKRPCSNSSKRTGPPGSPAAPFPGAAWPLAPAAPSSRALAHQVPARSLSCWQPSRHLACLLASVETWRLTLPDSENWFSTLFKRNQRHRQRLAKPSESWSGFSHPIRERGDTKEDSNNPRDGVPPGRGPPSLGSHLQAVRPRGLKTGPSLMSSWARS